MARIENIEEGMVIDINPEISPGVVSLRVVTFHDWSEEVMYIVTKKDGRKDYGRMSTNAFLRYVNRSKL